MQGTLLVLFGSAIARSCSVWGLSLQASRCLLNEVSFIHFQWERPESLMILNPIFEWKCRFFSWKIQNSEYFIRNFELQYLCWKVHKNCTSAYQSKPPRSNNKDEEVERCQPTWGSTVLTFMLIISFPYGFTI